LQQPDPTGVLAGYNARSWSWSKIAREFVAPEQYWMLIDGGDNQSLIGPRGTGKTTLLKMLCGPALEEWQVRDDDHDAARARAAVDFTGVFIPANKMWSGQVSALTQALDEDDDRDRFGLAAFTYMALRALVDAAEHRVHGPAISTAHRRVNLSAGAEAELATDAAEAFGAPTSSASLRALRVSLTRNVASLGRSLRRVANRSIDARERSAIYASSLLDVDFYSAASLFCQTFDDLVGEPEAAWAFLLDELEFLPVGARAEIAESVQGQDPKLRFKVSLAPWTDPQTSYLHGVPFNDFTQVELMPSHREAAHAFAQRLFARELRSRRRAETPQGLLGPGGFEPETPRDSYADGGENAELIRQLAAEDPSFARWLDRRGIDAHGDLAKLSEAHYGQLRKAAPLVRLRLAYGKPGPHGDRVGRSRKRPDDLYAGAQSIWAMSEGNPRWLKAFAHELFARHRAPGSAPHGVQLQAAGAVADNYFGYFRTMEDIGDPPAGLMPTPYHLLMALGRYFERQVHGNDFTADPVTMARPDRDDHWIDALINALVFLGGLVRQEDAEGPRVRLAHMFAPRFRLPPRNGNASPLSTVLAGAIPEQLSLIDDGQRL
jgi:hypothetical protein